MHKMEHFTYDVKSKHTESSQHLEDSSITITVTASIPLLLEDFKISRAGAQPYDRLFPLR